MYDFFRRGVVFGRVASGVAFGRVASGAVFGRGELSTYQVLQHDPCRRVMIFNYLVGVNYQVPQPSS